MFVDNGLLRLDEGDKVMETFNQQLKLPVTRVDVTKEMMDRLRGVTDPEAKRKAIGAEFIECFKRFRCGNLSVAAMLQIHSVFMFSLSTCSVQSGACAL